jgi:membrane associated rhomboid family serine protease
VTYGLIAANVLVFLALWPLAWQPPDVADPAFADYVRTIATDRQIPRSEWPALAQAMVSSLSAYDLVILEHGFRPASPSIPKVFTAMFLHAGLFHLLGNMLFLWIYGDNVEHRLGRLGFLVVYLLTGCAATAGDALLRMGSAIPSVGASGAISGVLGLYFIWFPHNRVRMVAFLPFGWIFELSARVVLGLYILVDNLLPWLLAGGRTSGVAHGAHIGGFLAGVIVALALDRWSLGRREPDLRVRTAPRDRPPRLAEAFRSALDGGQLVRAAGMLFDPPRATTRAELGPEDKIRLGDALARSGHPRAALAAYQRALSDHPRDPSGTRAHLHAARVLIDSLNMPTAAYQHLYAALEERPSAEDAALARSLLAELNERSASVPRGFE